MTPSMTVSRVGDVVSVEFPFTDMQGRKRRPGVVLAGDTSDLLLARITTHEPRDSFDVQLDDWTIAGLPKPSTVRLMKLASLDVRLIHHTIGRVSAGDRTKLGQAIERMGLQIAQAIRQ
jgi:mRNA interferase MazF